MVDVGSKPASQRWATARTSVSLSADALTLVGQADKQAGSFRTVVETAGMLAA